MSGIMSMLLGARTAIAVAVDEFFNRVTLLLPGDGTNGAQNNTFLDSSTNNFTITRNGNTTQGTFSPFSQTGWSNFFDGAGDYLTGSAPLVQTTSTSTFTFEGWIYPTTFANVIYPLGDMDPTGGTFAIGIQITTSGIPQLYWFDGAGKTCSGAAMVLNQWNYFAFVVNANAITAYVNSATASQSGTTTLTNRTQTNNFAIGQWNNSTTPNAYISNLRFSTVARTISAVPTAPFTADANTRLLTCQSNRFVDNSTNAFTITRNGDVSVQPFSPFAPTIPYSAATVGGSGYFDGTGDSLVSTTDFESATNVSTFTIEGFVYPTSFSALTNIIGGMVVSSGDQKSIAAEVNTSGQVALYWFDGAVKRCTGNSVMQLNAWNYFAIVVSSNSISIYVNKTTSDTLSGTTTLTSRTQSTDLGVGAYYNNNSPAQYFNGYLANLRYSTVARTISAVPTVPFTSDSDTRWLLNFTNAGIIDATAKNVLETVGNAQISTTQSKFGGSSISFDGTGDYLVIPKRPFFDFPGDFTIEFWLYANSLASYGFIMDTRSSASTFWLMDLSTSGVIGWGPDATIRISSSSISTGQWYHVAVARSGSSTKMFLNGTQTGSTYTSSASITAGTTNVVVGGSALNPGSFNVNCYIDDLRITVGHARYTSNFTAPTSAFPLQ